MSAKKSASRQAASSRRAMVVQYSNDRYPVAVSSSGCRHIPSNSGAGMHWVRTFRCTVSTFRLPVRPSVAGHHRFVHPGMERLMTGDRRGRRWNTVPEILVACAGQRPNVPVLADTAGTRVTASALLDRTRRGATILFDRGVRRGHFVAVDTTSLPWNEVAAAYFSVVWNGAVAVLAMGEDSERIALERIGAVVLISGSGRSAPGVGGLAAADLAASPATAGPPAARPDDPLDIVFTSGTTGLPKPVASTHEQWIGSVRPEIMASRGRRVVAHTGIPIGVSGGLHG